MTAPLLAFICLVVAFDGCIGIAFTTAWSRALKQTLFEQEVEDVNAVHKVDNHLVRRLIVMPLTDAFKPHQADLMHGKVQYGDKCSLPTSIGRLIFEKRYEVPWLFEIKPVTRANVQQTDVLSTKLDHLEDSQDSTHSAADRRIPKTPTVASVKPLEKAYISPLDFRSPENYIFLPKWLMKDLAVAPNDVVDVSFVRIKLADLVVFQPLSLEWDALIEKVKDPKALLEHEINKYSSLTAGSTIYIEIDKQEYPLYVKATFAAGGVAVKAVRVQDSDIRTDIDRSILDELKKQKKIDGITASL